MCTAPANSMPQLPHRPLETRTIPSAAVSNGPPAPKWQVAPPAPQMRTGPTNRPTCPLHAPERSHTELLRSPTASPPRKTTRHRLCPDPPRTPLFARRANNGEIIRRNFTAHSPKPSSRYLLTGPRLSARSDAAFSRPAHASISWCHRPEAGDTPKKISYVFFELSYAPNRSPSPGRPHGTSIPRPDRLHIAKLRP